MNNLNIKFDKEAVEKMINDSVNEVWSSKIQDNNYKELVEQLNKIGINLSSEQELALKGSFNYVCMTSTKQSLIATINFFKKLGLFS